MFADNALLKFLDLSNLKTNKVTNMKGFFKGCRNLETINLGGNFDTPQVTYMSYMFYN